MANDIPRQILSEHFQERLTNRRVLGAIFLTFEFDPGFFEQEVLPAILDVAVSHAEVPRLLQLETALRELDLGIAVFYDWRGLKSSGDYAAPRLNVQRIPVRVGTGIFHPKNVLLLTEDRDPDENGARRKRLLVACMSANLTRTGWWENVEVCYIDDLGEGAATILRDPLLELIDRVQRFATNPNTVAVLAPYRVFIRKLEQRLQKSQNGWLWPSLYVGGGGMGEDIADFVAAAIPADSKYSLEIISPFFDKSPAASPLFKLIKRLKPDEVRILLPRDAAGTAQCSEELFDAVRELGAEWGKLPDDFLQLGRAADAGRRAVHAKVYRLFNTHPKREYLFVGSANLTAPAHSGTGGNLETGVLVQIDPPRRPDFWLQADRRRPALFHAVKAEDSEDSHASVPVQIRFSWKRDEAFGRWDETSPCPKIELRGQGPVIASDLRFPNRQWAPLPAEAVAGIRVELKSLSILTVRLDDDREAKILVQEEDMDLKPELLSRLPVRDILQYWSLLKPEQRQAFLESRAALLSPGELGGLMAAVDDGTLPANDMFTRCAGVFHAFATLEKKLAESFPGHQHQAAALLFGERFDSLGTLLARVLREESAEQGIDQLDVIDRYLVLMCAQQLWNTMRIHHQEFIGDYSRQAAQLCERLAQRAIVRDQIIDIASGEMPVFLDWFDRWFLLQAEPMVRP
jgi:hypothetical protein